MVEISASILTVEKGREAETFLTLEKSKIDYFINRFWRALIPDKSIPLTNKEPQNAINLFSFFYMHFP